MGTIWRARAGCSSTQVLATSFAPMAAEAETTLDAVLGGRLTLRQSRRGHRVGHDAILLAAATQAQSGEHAVELGAGVGAAGLALALRVPALKVTLVEIDAALAALARENAAHNGLGDRVQVAALDVRGPDREFVQAGIQQQTATHVLMNPPFSDPARQNVSPDPQRLLAPSVSLTLIWRADGLDNVLAAARADFGGVAVLPVYPRPNAAAIRILVRAIKGSRAPLALLPGLT